MSPSFEQDRRCPQCDSRLAAGADRCLMCGFVLPPSEGRPEPAQATPCNSDAVGAPVATGAATESPIVPTEQQEEAGVLVEADAVPFAASGGARPSAEDGVVSSTVRERQSRIVLWMTAVAVVITALIGAFVLQYGGPVQLALLPTITPIPPTASFTPTVTLPPTETPLPTATPQPTATPLATPTLQPPRAHAVTEGETLFGLSLIYNVGMEAIAALNGFSMESPIQSGQALQIPWPTATPPLEPIALDINGETVIADPTNCERYQIQEGDAISVIAARENINMELLMRVNRLTEQSVVQPGDTLCIPEVLYGDVLPPTPGPSPTPEPTGFPAGPRPLYPPPGAVVETDGPLVLQWIAVKDLLPDEWYMVEMTDVSETGIHPRRGFTRQTSFRVPSSWRPQEIAVHDFEWRVSIVRVTGQRADGSLVYTFGGRAGQTARLSWLGAIPTPTPTPTVTPLPEAN